MNYRLDRFRKEKKAKELRDLAFLGKKKKRISKQSDREQILSKIIKKNIKEGEMGEELRKIGFKGADYLVDFFEVLYKSKVDIKSWGLSKNLITKPIKMYIPGEFQNDLITSDMLFWSYQAADAVNNNVYKDFLKLSRVHICSAIPLFYQAEHEIQEYYYEDLDKNIFCPIYPNGFNFAFPDNAKEFIIFGTRYKATAELPNVPIFIAPATATSENIKTKVTKAKKFKDRKDLSLGIKKINKDEGSYYFQHIITLTNFCPTIMILAKSEETNQPWKFNVLYEFEVVPELLIESLTRNFDSIFDILDHIISWENLELVYEIIGVALLTNPDGNEATRTKLTEIWEFYKNNRHTLALFKKLFISFRKIVLTYLDSFNSRISIDKMDRIDQLCTTFIDSYESVNNNVEDKETAQKYANFFTTAERFKKFVNLDILVIAKGIKKICKTVVNPSRGQEAEIEQDVRAIAFRLFDLLYNGKDAMFDEIRAPNAFLGNTIGDSTENVLQQVLATLFGKVIQKEVENNMMQVDQEQIANDTKDEIMNILKKEVKLDNKTINQISASLNKRAMTEIVNKNIQKKRNRVNKNVRKGGKEKKKKGDKKKDDDEDEDEEEDEKDEEVNTNAQSNLFSQG